MKEAVESVCQKEVFRDFFNDNFNSIFKLIYYKFGDENRAKDVAQEAFVVLWENCSSVSKAKAWSYVSRVAHNKMVNCVVREKMILKYRANNKTTNINEITPETELYDNQLLEVLQNLIAKMGGNERQVYLLSRVENKTYKEISMMVGISVKAVERRMSLALKFLKSELKIYLDEKC